MELLFSFLLGILILTFGSLFIWIVYSIAHEKDVEEDDDKE